MKKNLLVLLPVYLFVLHSFAQNGNVGIGTNTPAYRLDVAGNGRYTGPLMIGAYTLPNADGTGNQVLTTNGMGIVSWQSIAAGSSGWSLTGNSATDPIYHFVGTTDNQSLVFKANNVLAGKIDLPLNNTLFGSQAGLAITTGTGNTAVGAGALKRNTTATANVAIGLSALSAVTTAGSNTAIGAYSMQNTITGSNNTAQGYATLGANTTGSGNTAVGAASLQSNTTGINNTCHGNGTLQFGTTANNNTAAGAFSLQYATGSSNTAIGYTSGGAITTGAFNTAIGTSAGVTNTTGSNNTFLGSGADASSAALINATAIGYYAKVNASNSLVLGGTGSYAVNVGIGTTAPTARLEVNSGVVNTSGLKITNLTSATPTTAASAILGIDASGNVVTSSTSVPAFTGATATVAGAAGLVPAPAVGAQNKFLIGSGAWAQGFPLISANGTSAATTETRDYNAWVTKGTGFYLTDVVAAPTNQIPNESAWFAFSQVAANSSYFGQTSLSDHNFYFRGGAVAGLATAAWYRMLSVPATSLTKMVIDTLNNATLNNIDNAYLAFATNNTEKMRITASGYVGIGTTAPGNTLDVNSGTGGVSGLRIRQLAAGGVLFMSAASDLTVNSSNFYFDATNYRLGISAGTTPNSTLHVNGSIALGISTKTANYTAGVMDHTLLCNTAAGAFSISLPNPVGAAGRTYVIKKISADANAVTIVTYTGSSTIDGAATCVLSTQYGTVEMQTDGTAWYILAKK